VFDLEKVALLYFVHAGFRRDREFVVSAAGGLLSELIQHAQSVAHVYPRGEFVGGDQRGCGPIQQFLVVKFRRRRYSVDLLYELVDLFLDLRSVHRGVGVVRGLYGQFSHSLQDRVGFVQRAFRSLDKRYSVLRVPRRLL